ncbi:hypothetical protein [Chitinophaga sp.]|uniref:hypothetical protein n=1 Tax=Chitinophaga sp. TaxID=1869181 RepID=UPI002BB51611|nr:hypothetical protein [Chitinophaga sp.]HWV64357.1 hypothetical protein [Chitinophaga sp.]
MAEFERITVEQVYELSTTNFLNDLAYLKDKAALDEQIAEQWRRNVKGNRT